MPPEHAPLIYVAGPLFSESERAWDERIAAVCEHAGYRTFLPHRDAGLQDERNAEAIFRQDMDKLHGCDLLVANLDGVDVDAGTAWEIGYVRALRKQVIGVRTDRRVLEPWSRVNLMIEQSCRIVSCLQDLDCALHAWRGELKFGAHWLADDCTEVR